ncbi:unnamed protein product [Schistosoma curassoni]|uniref:Secreted protein n=1 Tax=Schistosoma curassoni TaxID=6186 RepID=A0A183L3U5_9TREM|nr:unnamed protein product [Schistosoma curassoni]
MSIVSRVALQMLTSSSSCRSPGERERLSQLLRSPFFGILTRSPSFQSLGTSSSTQILLSAFSASTGLLSGNASLPLLICLMAMLIFSIVGGPTLIGRSVGAASMLGGLSGAGRFKSSLKCSTPLFRCSSMLVITSPSLVFTGRSGLRRFPESFFVMSYGCLTFPSLAAFSAVIARSSTYLRLSVLMLLFTCLSTSVYSARALAFSVLVRLVLIAAFLFLHS